MVAPKTKAITIYHVTSPYVRDELESNLASLRQDVEYEERRVEELKESASQIKEAEQQLADTLTGIEEIVDLLGYDPEA